MYLLGSGWASENLRPKPGTALKVLGGSWPKILSSIVSTPEVLGGRTPMKHGHRVGTSSILFPTPAPKGNAPGRSPGITNGHTEAGTLSVQCCPTPHAPILRTSLPGCLGTRRLNAGTWCGPGAPAGPIPPASAWWRPGPQPAQCPVYQRAL